ncbi:MAG TPA: hypothetical protein VH000_04450 [Rhizomicrobium sp.]|jgi:hypothetical protein|nr:hypothetical protein [Rhizomicrobium sp.]HEX4533460.1 hypothetical protein [Rhizomicrobium sp.]
MTARANDRQARLAAALRENLKRRKQRGKAVVSGDDGAKAEPHVDKNAVRPNTAKKPV